MEWSQRHLSALGAAVGRSITHVTLASHTYNQEQLWSGLWAAFPELQSLTVHDSSLLLDIPAVASFCAAAPHAIHLSVNTCSFLAVEEQIDAALCGTRVLLTTHTP
jgi:hypothetical protein